MYSAVGAVQHMLSSLLDFNQMGRVISINFATSINGICLLFSPFFILPSLSPFSFILSCSSFPCFLLLLFFFFLFLTYFFTVSSANSFASQSPAQSSHKRINEEHFHTKLQLRNTLTSSSSNNNSNDSATSSSLNFFEIHYFLLDRLPDSYEETVALVKLVTPVSRDHGHASLLQWLHFLKRCVPLSPLHPSISLALACCVLSLLTTKLFLL